MLQFLSRAVELVPEVKAHLSDKALEVLKSIDTYDRQLWKYALDLYRGGDPGVFITDFVNAISNQLTRAWNSGALEMGVTPKDMTDDDHAEIQAIINAEYEHILDLGTAITAAQQGTIQEFRDAFRSRIDMWINRYTDVVNQAKIYFGGKTRLEWVEGDTLEKCPTCLALNGIVAFAQEWEQSGVRPQSPPNNAIECGGWNCGCSLEPTDKRRSPNALQRIMDIATAANVGKSYKYDPNQPRDEIGRWTDEDIVIGKMRNGWGEESEDIYKITDCTHLLEKYNMVIVSIKSNEIYATKVSGSHIDIIRVVDPERSEDKYVRMTVNSFHSMTANTKFAGIRLDGTKETELKAMNNIYSALDKLTAMGMPKDTKVLIFDQDWNQIVVSAKSYNPSQPRVPAGDEHGGEWTVEETIILDKRLDQFRIKLRDWGAEASAEYDGSISINKNKWQEITPNGKQFIMVHEIIHQTVENEMMKEYVINPDYMDEVANTLILEVNKNGDKLFLGGTTKLNESVADVLSAYINGEDIPKASPAVYEWAKLTIRRYGYNDNDIREIARQAVIETDRIINE